MLVIVVVQPHTKDTKQCLWFVVVQPHTKDTKQCLWLLWFSHTLRIQSNACDSCGSATHLTFCLFLKCHANNTNKNLHSMRWSPLTLEKLVQILSLLQKESWVAPSAGVSKAWREYGHCTSVFAFGFFGDVKQTVHQTFTRYWHHKKDMMGYDPNCD